MTRICAISIHYIRLTTTSYKGSGTDRYLTEIAWPITVIYEGNDTDRHIINAQALGKSMIGASKLYNAIAH